MATSPIGASSPAAATTFNAARSAPSVKNTDQAQDAKAPTQAPVTAGTLRTQQNGMILQASMDVSIKSANSSLALLYRTAIDNINLALEPELGPDAIGQAATQDNTPEATAGRILSLSTAFYDAYAAQSKNKGLDEETVARNFVDVIRGGFERGFGEARDILSGLGVLGADSPIEQGINQTYALVMKGYDDFLATKLGTGQAADAPAAA